MVGQSSLSSSSCSFFRTTRFSSEAFSLFYILDMPRTINASAKKRKSQTANIVYEDDLEDEMAVRREDDVDDDDDDELLDEDEEEEEVTPPSAKKKSRHPPPSVKQQRALMKRRDGQGLYDRYVNGEGRVADTRRVVVHRSRQDQDALLQIRQQQDVVDFESLSFDACADTPRTMIMKKKNWPRRMLAIVTGVQRRKFRESQEEPSIVWGLQVHRGLRRQRTRPFS